MKLPFLFYKVFLVFPSLFMTGKEIHSGIHKTALVQVIVEIRKKTNLVWQLDFGLLLPLQSVCLHYIYISLTCL